MNTSKNYSIVLRCWFAAKMAAHGILSNPLRSSLSVLGIAIGVASVVSLMGIGEGARKAVIDQFESLGSNVIVIRAHQSSVEFNPDEVSELTERVEGLNQASPIVYTKAIMTWKRARGNVEIIGTNQEFPTIRDHELIYGHFFTKWHVEQRLPVAVLGYNMGLGLLQGKNPVGRSINLNGQNYRVLGVLSAKGKGKADDIDDKIIIPYTTALKIAEKRTLEEIWAKAGSRTEADLAVVQLGRIYKRKLGMDQSAPTISPADGGGAPQEGVMDERMIKEVSGRAMPGQTQPPAVPDLLQTGEDLITITSMNQMVEEADTANRIMTMLLGGIAAVSLIVGGLGIMNIMLVAVTERIEEIGLRRALGAKQEDLLFQFILEALYVSIIGSITGVTVGLWGMGIFQTFGFKTAVSFKAINIAVLVALASGLLFGIYPAISASSVPPVEALRRR